MSLAPAVIEPKARILIVEDERIVARDLAGTLDELGYLVVASFASGEEVVHSVGSLQPDLILMDINLAGALDGVQTAEAIKEYNIPVIYLTAHSDEKTLERAKVTAPFGYLVKPFKVAEMRCAIEIALYKHQIDIQVLQVFESLALNDELTWLANRRGLMARVSQLMLEGQRGREFVLVMIDIDHFKVINDTHGHAVGDQVLVAVAATIKQHLRAVDFAARYGGDEFCLLLVDTSAVKATGALHRLRSCLADFPQAVRITASLGACSYRAEFGKNFEAMLAVADQALYRAKQKGRNCVEIDE